MIRPTTKAWLLVAACTAMWSLACRAPANVKTQAHASPPSVGSAYPVAVDPSKVGTYPAFTKSGAGYFYDDVLEYRVWVHHAAGGDDTYEAFATFEQAKDYSRKVAGAEEPLALVLQREWVNEPTPGQFVHEKGERITEWRTEWLDGKNHRTPGAIENFMKERRGRTRG